MRMIIGLDAPTSGTVTVDGQHYGTLPFPLHEVGALLEAPPSTPAAPPTTTCGPRPHQRHPARPASTRSSTWPASPKSPAAAQGLLPRHGPAPRHRHRLPRRPGQRRPRRAGQRPRPRRHQLDPQTAPVPCRGRPNGHRLQPPHERDGPHRRPPGRHRPRPTHRRRHGRPSSSARQPRERSGSSPRTGAPPYASCQAPGVPLTTTPTREPSRQRHGRRAHRPRRRRPRHPPLELTPNTASSKRPSWNSRTTRWCVAATLEGAADEAAPAPAPAYRVTHSRVLHSEWREFWTLRSTWITLVATGALDPPHGRGPRRRLRAGSSGGELRRGSCCSSSSAPSSPRSTWASSASSSTAGKKKTGQDPRHDDSGPDPGCRSCAPRPPSSAAGEFVLTLWTNLLEPPLRPVPSSPAPPRGLPWRPRHPARPRRQRRRPRAPHPCWPRPRRPRPLGADRHGRLIELSR